MAEAIEIIPPGWWGIVLVGMALPADHPAIQRQAHKKDVPDNWRYTYCKATGMKMPAFDNALKAGLREVTEARPPRMPGHDRWWESQCRHFTREREVQLCLWMASFNEVPLLVRKALSGWAADMRLIRDLHTLGVEPECWEWDNDAMDRVPTPNFDTVKPERWAAA